jgi:molybdopterin-guanine dinucleotide biosynthesis protein A
VILTGGTARRMEGADKASLELGGLTLLEHALAATADAGQVVVVGQPVASSRPVTWTREDPPLGGPAAALLAGMVALAPDAQAFWVLAVDMPRVTRTTMQRLADALRDAPEAAGVVLVDDEGQRQPLAAIYRRARLAGVRPGGDREAGLSLRRLLTDLPLVEVPSVGLESQDVDTWRDLESLRAESTDPVAKSEPTYDA